MAEKLGEALLDLDTDDKRFRDGIQRAERDAQDLGITIDNTARKAMLLGKVLGAATAIGSAAFGKGVADAIGRLEVMRKSSAQVDQALANSGNTAKTSAAEIGQWADQLEMRTGRAAEEVMAVASNLATYGFGREEFFRAIQLADDMAAAWGGDLKQNLEGLSRALDDPINGMAMLSKRGVKLTDDQKQLAAQFLATGDKARAQGVVFAALEAQVKGVAEAGFNGLTKALALAQKRWEDAFEDLVTGKGDASDLRDTLVNLANTLSSREFIDAAMGFGEVLVQGIDQAAKAIIWTWGKAKEFIAWLNGQDPKNLSAGNIEAEIAKLQNLQELAAASTAGDWYMGLFGATSEQRVAGYQKKIDALQGELAKRSDPTQFDVGGSFSQLNGQTYDTPEALWRSLKPGFGVGNTAPVAPVLTDDQQKQKAARADLIADLEHERDLVGKTAIEQDILNAQRRAGVDAMSAEGQQIRMLITETEAHKAAIERQQQAYEVLGQIGGTALKGLISAMEDGKVTGNELLGILADVLKLAAQFFMQQAISGMGEANPLGTILKGVFSGFFAKGGLIPSGTFGIVGENGPEPIIGTSRGAMVLPNSSLSGMGRGDINVHINGSNLSQSELTQAVADGISRYDRQQLPSRVRQINADPLARG